MNTFLRHDLRHESPYADWRADASCVNHDPEWWFQILPNGPNPRKQLQVSRKIEDARTLYALSICGSCPVRDECEREVMAREGDCRTSSRYGVWAGLLPDERSALRRKRTRRRTA